MLFILFATFVLLPFTSSSPATSASSPEATYWISERNVTYNETDTYTPGFVWCEQTGDSCEDACYGASTCNNYYNDPTVATCYWPDYGEVCCPDGAGLSCDPHHFCAMGDNGQTYCCERDLSVYDCAYNLNFSLAVETGQATTATIYVTSFSLPEPSGSTVTTRFTLIYSKTDHPTTTITSTSERSTQTFTVLAQSSSSSSMSTGAKVGIIVGVHVAVLGLGLIATLVWLRRHRQKKEAKPRQPPWEVDAQESQLTAEQLERKRNEPPPADHDPDTYIEVPQEIGSPRATEMREDSERLDDVEMPLISGGLAVSPVSPNRSTVGASPSPSLPLHRSISPIPATLFGEVLEPPVDRREEN